MAQTPSLKSERKPVMNFKQMRYATQLDVIGRAVESQRMDAGTLLSTEEDIKGFDTVNSYGLISNDFDDPYQDVELQVRGVH